MTFFPLGSSGFHSIDDKFRALKLDNLSTPANASSTPNKSGSHNNFSLGSAAAGISDSGYISHGNGNDHASGAGAAAASDSHHSGGTSLADHHHHPQHHHAAAAAAAAAGTTGLSEQTINAMLKPHSFRGASTELSSMLSVIYVQIFLCQLS